MRHATKKAERKFIKWTMRLMQSKRFQYPIVLGALLIAWHNPELIACPILQLVDFICESCK